MNKKAFCVLEFAETESIVTCNGGFGSCTTQNHLQTKQFVNGTWIPAEWLPVRFTEGWATSVLIGQEAGSGPKSSFVGMTAKRQILVN